MPLQAVHSVVLPDDELILRAAASEIVNRLYLARALGQTYDGKRDLGLILGYQDDLTVQDYRIRYERGGIAGTIVDVMPNATWRGGVELVEDETTQEASTDFERDWRLLDDRLHISERMLKVDILASLSTFSALVIGAPGMASEELPPGKGPAGILFLKPYCGEGGEAAPRQTRSQALAQVGVIWASAKVSKLEERTDNERYGQPVEYEIRTLGLNSKVVSPTAVHWTRVIHVAEGCLDDEIYGQPKLRRPWNRLDDLEKVTGGGSEAFFQRANQGRNYKVDKDLIDLTEEQRADIRKQAEAIEHGISRQMFTRGVDVQTFGSDVANFSESADALLTQIAGITRIPKRILTGSEMGELASSQDRDNFRDQVNGRREQHAGPNMLRRLADRLIAFGYLASPKTYVARWGAVMNMTEEERRTKAKSWAETQTEEGPCFTRSEIREACYEMPPMSDEQLAELEVAKPEPAAFGFPRAASEDLVSELARALEQNDTVAIDRILEAAL